MQAISVVARPVVPVAAHATGCQAQDPWPPWCRALMTGDDVVAAGIRDRTGLGWDGMDGRGREGAGHHVSSTSTSDGWDGMDGWMDGLGWDGLGWMGWDSSKTVKWK